MTKFSYFQLAYELNIQELFTDVLVKWDFEPLQ